MLIWRKFFLFHSNSVLQAQRYISEKWCLEKLRSYSDIVIWKNWQLAKNIETNEFKTLYIKQLGLYNSALKKKKNSLTSTSETGQKIYLFVFYLINWSIVHVAYTFFIKANWIRTARLKSLKNKNKITKFWDWQVQK